MSKLIAFVTAALLCGAACAAAPTEESVNALLTASRSEKGLDQFHVFYMNMFREGMRASLKGQQPTEEQQRRRDAIAAKFERVIREELSWESLRPLYVQIYRETFTQQEIDGLIAFYKSPAGTALLDKMPIVLQKGEVVLKDRVGPLAEKLKAAIAEAVEETKPAK